MNELSKLRLPVFQVVIVLTVLIDQSILLSYLLFHFFHLPVRVLYQRNPLLLHLKQLDLQILDLLLVMFFLQPFAEIICGICIIGIHNYNILVANSVDFFLQSLYFLLFVELIKH
jgi:hypothetical protein